jgi:CDP-diacylglycerol--glycerol-3-phosphate 3-phosphatidyltransferase
MARKISWPNIVTVSRLGLVFVVVMLAYGNTIWNKLLASLFAVMVIIGDWLDGHLARRLGQSTKLGSVLDIAADRVMESVLWIILADLTLVPIWIPIVVISRGIVTDTIRGYVLQFGYAGFGKKTMQKSRLGKFITGSPFMRTSYAVLKGFTFGWLLLLKALEEVLVRKQFFEAAWMETALEIGYWAAVLAAIICIVRGVPVVIEGIALIQEKDAEK